MNSQIRSYKTHTHNLQIPNLRKIPGPKNCELRGFTVRTLFSETLPGDREFFNETFMDVASKSGFLFVVTQNLELCTF